MAPNHDSGRKIGLLTISVSLGALIWIVGGIVLVVLLQQQARIDRQAQRIFDVSSAKVFEATRTVRGLERLAREGDAIHWITDPAERSSRRQRLQSLLDDASVSGDPKVRPVVTLGFATLDQNISELASRGVDAHAGAVARWGPVMQDILNQSETVGAEVADLAAQEADLILETTEIARRVLLWVAGALALASAALFYLIHLRLTRPLVRLTQALMQARDGEPIAHRRESVRELHTLHEAAEALSDTHRQLESARMQMEQLALTDGLTGLANRRMFEMQGQQSFLHARRYGDPLCAFMFDIDFFKRINDQYGHAGGDIVLREMGVYLRSAQRGSDGPAARVGGEEFCLLLTRSDLQEAAITAERLRQGIAQLKIAMPGGDLLQFTVSMGVAQCKQDDIDLNALLHRADMALYAAKQSGRNRVELAP